MQEGEPKNGYREQEAAGGTYAPKKVPELERQRQARIKRLQELERQQIELHKQRIINGTLSRRCLLYTSISVDISKPLGKGAA